MSDIPVDWRKVKLIEVVREMTAGQSPNRKEHQARYGKKGILKTTAIQWGEYIPSENREALPGFSANVNTIVCKNDILITKAGPSHRVGVVAISKEDAGSLHVSGKMAIIRANENADPAFLAYQMSHHNFQVQLQSDITGMALSQTNFTHENLLSKEVVLPPLPEQKKIAEILSGIDSSIARNQSKARVLAMMHEVVSSKIFSDISNDSTSCIKRIDEISTLKGGNGFPVEHQGKTAGGTPFIKVSDFNTSGNEDSILHSNNYLSSESMTVLRPYVFPKNTIVFAKVGAALTSNRRRILSMPTCIDNNLMGAIPESVKPRYLKFLLERIDFNEFVQDGAVPSVNQSQIGQIEVSIPSMDKQIKVIETLESLRKCQHLIDMAINKKILQKQAVSSDLLSGRKRVRI